MKRILINATHPEEIRSALVEGQSLFDLDIENRSKQQKKSNIYKGKITRIESSLEAAFVDYGSERHGFLPLKEIADSYKNSKGVVDVGTDVIIQVDKEERGNKGASLTTYITLAGRYLVLQPNNSQGGGISRRIEGAQREEVRGIIKQLTIPSEHSVIVRTAVIGHSTEELQWDVNYLVQLWESISTEANKAKSPHFLFQESNIIIRSIRDYLRPAIGEVLIDSPDAYNLAMAFIGQVMPEYQDKIKLYNESEPLFNHFQIEKQIETAFNREVKLPSGGSIVIDMTEALTAIDVNSARSTRGGDIEETAVSTNLEAADEIARQLRLRDLGGIVIIDFIDMMANKNRIAVEDKFRKAIKIDRARTHMSRISSLGLIEMSRQRIRPSLDETIFNTCPRCDGLGRIRGMRSLALSILRLIEEEAQKDNTQEVRVFSAVDICTFLLNEKRSLIENIEKIHGVRVIIIPQLNMENPHYDVMRIRDNDDASNKASYSLQHQKDDKTQQFDTTAQTVENNPQPAIQTTLPAQSPPPAPKQKKPETQSPGLFAKIAAALNNLFSSDDKSKKKKTNQRPQKKGSNQSQGNRKPRQPRNSNRPAGTNKQANNRQQQQNSRQNNQRDNQRNNQKVNQRDISVSDQPSSSTKTTRATDIIRQKNRASYGDDATNDEKTTTNTRNKANQGRNKPSNSDGTENKNIATKPQADRKPRQRTRKEPEGELKAILGRVEPTENQNVNNANIANAQEQANQKNNSQETNSQEPLILSIKSNNSSIEETEATTKKKEKKPAKKPAKKVVEANDSDTQLSEVQPSKKPPQSEVSESPKTKGSDDATDKGTTDKAATSDNVNEKQVTVTEPIPVEEPKSKPKYKRPANDPRNKRKTDKVEKTESKANAEYVEQQKEAQTKVQAKETQSAQSNSAPSDPGVTTEKSES